MEKEIWKKITDFPLFCVHRSTVLKVIKRETWGHV
jgi:hypothetical protein